MNKKSKKGFTLSEALIVIAIIGVITAVYNIGIKVIDVAQKGFDVKANKTVENIDQVFNLIFAHHSESFDLTDLHDNSGNFSVTNSGVTTRFANFFKMYLVNADFHDVNDPELKDYFASTIMDYNRTSTGLTLKTAYSDFLATANGSIYGFRLYQSCSANETNANPPFARGRKTISGICGSVFYDVNGFSPPNKLGSDQYIVPFDSQGAKIKI